MKEVVIVNGSGVDCTFIVHKFSPLDGRSIIAGYPLALLAKDYTYDANLSAAKQLLKYCSVESEGEQVHLIDDALVNLHVTDWWALVQLEFACLKFNCSFLEDMDLLTVAKASMTELLRQMVSDRLEKIR